MVRRRNRVLAGVAALILAVVAALPGRPLRAEGVVKATSGDWETRCDTPTGAKGEQCALVQNVVAEDRPNITLVVIVLKPVDKKKPLMRVVAPPSSSCPRGSGSRSTRSMSAMFPSRIASAVAASARSRWTTS